MLRWCFTSAQRAISSSGENQCAACYLWPWLTQIFSSNRRPGQEVCFSQAATFTYAGNIKLPTYKWTIRKMTSKWLFFSQAFKAPFMYWGEGFIPHWLTPLWNKNKCAFCWIKAQLRPGCDHISSSTARRCGGKKNQNLIIRTRVSLSDWRSQFALIIHLGFAHVDVAARRVCKGVSQRHLIILLMFPKKIHSGLHLDLS